MKHEIKILLLIILIAVPYYVSAQKIYFEINAAEDDRKILENYNVQKSYSDTLQLHNELNELLSALWGRGYVTASVDSVLMKGDTVKADISVGKKYKWLELGAGNVPFDMLLQAGYKHKNFLSKPFSYDKVAQLNDDILDICEDNGYPFASVRLDSLFFSDSSISASLNLKKNNRIVIDSVVMRGKAKVVKKYLYKYLDIQPGDLYNESKVVLVPKKIKELLFVKEIKPFNIVFTDTKAKIVIYADKKKTSNFDGVLGVLPNSQATGKLLITGEVNLELVNAFYRGESVDLNWRKLQLNTQDLKISLIYPYLLNTPFGVDAKFTLYKNDTLYINILKNLGVRYMFSGTDYLKAFFENQTSSLLSPSSYENATVLPKYADVNINMYGLEYKMQMLDYIYSPRKGVDVKISGSAGNKRIKKIPELSEELYESIDLNSAQFKVSGYISGYIPLYSRSTIKISNEGAAIEGSNLFANELYRIGGLKSMRGFDEESITASFYNIVTAEYRFLFEQNSYLFAFWNGAYYESRTVEGFVHDTPYGFGAGICFETKAGIFSLSYALGKQFDNSIYFRSAKIHFGIVSYF
ncbi:MAG: BamA/TamA family outer membrane protein [Bacteroidota bacterium]